MKILMLKICVVLVLSSRLSVAETNTFFECTPFAASQVNWDTSETTKTNLVCKTPDGASENKVWIDQTGMGKDVEKVCRFWRWDLSRFTKNGSEYFYSQSTPHPSNGTGATDTETIVISRRDGKFDYTVSQVTGGGWTFKFNAVGDCVLKEETLKF